TGARAVQQDRIVEAAMRREFGDDWAVTVSKKDYNRTRKKALQPYRKRVELLEHGAVYLAINAMLWLIFFASHGLGPLLGDASAALAFPWPLLVSLGWGAGMVAHIA